MAQVIITIADADLPRVLDGVAGFFNYQPFLVPIIGPPEPNPETKAQFARRMVRETVKAWVTTYESQQAAETARATAVAGASGLGIS